MKEYYLYGALLLFVYFAVFGFGLSCHAEVHSVTTNPVKKCGPRCVIESFAFDTEEEAKKFAKENDVLVYELSGSPGIFFVDVMMSEAESEMRAE